MSEEAQEGRNAYVEKRAAGLLASSRGGRSAPSGPTAARIWLMAARPRTLPAAVAPVLVGTALAATRGDVQAADASSPR